ncbi:MAG: Glu/Leu/Phe/Val dehydrogenase, partial [Planctomycetes bacterium]|nr:Glu/Leu/Phe/Val dehydrogenase [Planctomycetota bacterium]
SGLRAIIAIDSTKLGPAVGGCRFMAYGSEDNALQDVLRLAKAMTYKSAVSELNYGGGKAVIIKDESCGDRSPLFKKFGHFVESLKGKYITAVDSGTTAMDMVNIHSETSYVAGIPTERSGLGDPSPITARGVVWGMKASLFELYGNASLENRVIAIQGVGNVGYHLALFLKKEGARLIVADIHKERLKRLANVIKVKIVSTEDICVQDVDILSPCALSSAVNENITPTLKCKIIAGAANNQLLKDTDADSLFQKGIVYVPDYVINAGGLIHVVSEYEGQTLEYVYKAVSNIYQRVSSVLSLSREKNLPPIRIADMMAEERINKLASRR